VQSNPLFSFDVSEVFPILKKLFPHFTNCDMELIERDEFLGLLQKHLKNVEEGDGHCVLISGEAGIGKTALVKAFCKQHEGECDIFQGACDDLFTPRHLAPIYDILSQVNKDLLPSSHSGKDRSDLFSNFLEAFRNRVKKFLIVFEDIHWADEATLDFIKFFAKRISQMPCLFILTYRDNEIHSRHPLRNVIGQLPPDSFTKVSITPLSKQAVEKLADSKGYSGEDVYSISGGNPFYVNEILASYSPGVPDNIKDSILSVYERQEEGTKHAWQICSVIPEGLEVNRFAKIRASWDAGMDHCFAMNVIIVKNDKVIFKHELYRRTIEESLSPFKRIELNKLILELFLESFEEKGEIERIVHYAKNSNEYELVAKYAPLVASRSACVGAHVEASRLYFSAIEYYQGNDNDTLIQLYESYAYECYLTNQITESIIYTVKALDLWREKNNIKKITNSLRLLSRLWWLNGNRKNAESYAEQAIEIISNEPSSPVKAMAFSNMSQLKRLFDQPTECIIWGEKAIAIARELNDEETLSHALNNVGSVQMNLPSSKQKGIGLLQESLAIALKNSFHEHAARAYSNLGCNVSKLKDYVFAKKILDEGIQYCEERELDSWRLNMLSLKAQVNLETGDSEKAYSIANNLLTNQDQPRAFKIGALIVLGTIKMRRGDTDAIDFLLQAKTKAFETMELERIFPALIALLEYEWLTGKIYIPEEELNEIISRIEQSIYLADNSEFTFWLRKVTKREINLSELYEPYKLIKAGKIASAAEFWETTGCPVKKAFALFEGNEENKKDALLIFQQLGATAVCEKLKMEMRAGGIRNIPRGIRESTKANPAQLTNRELDVIYLLQKAVQNKEIAETLFISPKTVDNHISSILFKLDVNSRSKAVVEALRLGILK
jgi:DNA-binding CsgD family transcriptional regulator/tetratricopeptide (TPR) repeat protein